MDRLTHPDLRAPRKLRAAAQDEDMGRIIIPNGEEPQAVSWVSPNDHKTEASAPGFWAPLLVSWSMAIASEGMYKVSLNLLGIGLLPGVHCP